jgi:hypothetical protein
MRSKEAFEHYGLYSQPGWSLVANHSSSDADNRLTVFDFMNRQKVALREAVEVCKSDFRLTRLLKNLEAYASLIVETYEANRNLISAEYRRALNDLAAVTSNNTIRYMWLAAVNEKIAEKFSVTNFSNELDSFMYSEMLANEKVIDYTMNYLSSFTDYSKLLEEDVFNYEYEEDFTITPAPETSADYDFSLDRVASRTAMASVNRWEVGLDAHRMVSVKLNGQDIRVSSIKLESEPGNLIKLDLSVLIVPGSDILNFTNADLTVSNNAVRADVNSRYLDL